MIILNKYKVSDVMKFKRFMFLSLLLISIITFTSITSIKAYSKDIPQFDYVRVQHGDTLWSIASDYADNEDIRQVVYEISELNNIHNNPIHIGDIIKIPLN
ncbi:MAG: LysM peptidoglycan-binding domain-containing protein [Tissierellia bacterium]|nr:LysM peptidoglycan-binding domain-containing protein [Tissierellia bacterium]MDD4437343.1 LysM peptidoglycan-binding domain-containing protein [Tissierellia bacterium]